MASHRYISRTQAELEASEYSREHNCTVCVYKLEDGRYENVSGHAVPDRANSLIAEFSEGNQTV